jgi:hypothetical protein
VQVNIFEHFSLRPSPVSLSFVRGCLSILSGISPDSMIQFFPRVKKGSSQSDCKFEGNFSTVPVGAPTGFFHFFCYNAAQVLPLTLFIFMTKVTYHSRLTLTVILFAACAVLTVIGCGQSQTPEQAAVRKAMKEWMAAKNDVKSLDIKDAYKDAIKKINVQSCPEDFREVFDEFRSAHIVYLDCRDRINAAWMAKEVAGDAAQENIISAERDMSEAGEKAEKIEEKLFRVAKKYGFVYVERDPKAEVRWW